MVKCAATVIMISTSIAYSTTKIKNQLGSLNEEVTTTNYSDVINIYTTSNGLEFDISLRMNTPINDR